MKSVLCYPLYAYMEVLQNHILHRANCTQVHKQAPNKMAASAVSMVFYCRRGFGKSLLRKIEKFAFAGLFSKPIYQACATYFNGSDGSKQAGIGLWIAK